MRETKFLQMLIFYYYDLSPLFEFIISITILCHFYRYT